MHDIKTWMTKNMVDDKLYLLTTLTLSAKTGFRNG
jgi:hypothetical protein